MNQVQYPHQIQLLDVQQVADILGLCKATVWAHAKAVADFPKPFHLSAKATRWKLSELSAYIEHRSTTQQ